LTARALRPRPCLSCPGHSGAAGSKSRPAAWCSAAPPVQLAGSDFDRGATLLSQAQEHIGDARSLVERDRARADSTAVDESLLSAHDAIIGGQQALLTQFDRTGNIRALILVQDFAVRAMPQLNALRPLVPAASKPDVDSLSALLGQIRTTLVRKIAECGPRCAAIGGVRLGSPPSSAGTPGLSFAHPGGGLPIPALPASGPPVVGPVPAISGSGGVLVGPAAPTVAVTRGGTGGVILPPVSVGSVAVSPSPIVIAPLPRLSPLTPSVGSLPAPGLP